MLRGIALETTDVTEVDVDDSRLAPEAASIVQRTFDDGDVIALRRSDAFGRLLLDHLGAPSALALPIADRDRRFGVVLAPGRNEHSFDGTLGLARAYAQQAANALAQARLYALLGDRDDLRRALTNLVANALQHVQAGGSVEIAVRRNARNARRCPPAAPR